MRLCVALINVYVERNPIRTSEKDFYDNTKKKLYFLGVSFAEKRQSAKEIHRTRLRVRLENLNTDSLGQNESRVLHLLNAS